MNVKIFRVGDEFIIAEVGAGGGTGNIKMVNPRFLMPSQQGMAMMDMFSAFTDDKVLIIEANKVTYDMTPRDEIVDAYKRSVDPKTIVTPNNKLIVP